MYMEYAFYKVPHFHEIMRSNFIYCLEMNIILLQNDGIKDLDFKWI